jgi:hypothetical protein
MLKMNGKKIEVRRADIPSDLIQNAWELIKSDLKSKKYEVDSIMMPNIQAYIIHEEDYDRLTEEFMKSGPIETEEYGEPVDRFFSSAAVKRLNPDGTEWLLLVCNGRRPLETELNHELSHIFEFFLKLKLGTLAKE